MIPLLLLALLAGPTFTDLDGRPVTELTSPTGVVVMVVWCSTCGSCRANQAALDQLHRDYRDQVAVVALDAHPADTPERVRARLTEARSQLPVLFDPPGGMVDRLGIEFTTTTLVFDQAGTLRYFGPMVTEEGPLARRAVEELLAGRDVTVPARPQAGCPLPPR